MKKIFALVAVSCFALTATYAQSSGTPSFSSDAEKKAWIEANPEQYRQAVKADSDAFTPSKQAVKKTTASAQANRSAQSNSSIPKFSSDAEKQAWISANPQAYKAQPQIPANATKATQTLSGTPSGTAVVPATRVNNTGKALPANYKAAANESKTEQK